MTGEEQIIEEITDIHDLSLGQRMREAFLTSCSQYAIIGECLFPNYLSRSDFIGNRFVPELKHEIEYLPTSNCVECPFYMPINELRELLEILHDKEELNRLELLALPKIQIKREGDLNLRPT